MRAFRCVGIVLLFLGLAALTAAPEAVLAPVLKVDRLLAGHWKRSKIEPASPADDVALYRRVLLDLAGRIPTAQEVETFKRDRSTDRYERAVQRILAGPEFNHYFATVLDEVIQGRQAGNEGFLAFLRRGLEAKRGWDVLFREILLGPWDADATRGASAFLERRGRDLDVLTVDVGRAFLGVDISCARCHNHPLVSDWKQDHYYGLAAFLNRTEAAKGKISEKADGEVQFATRRGEQKTARMMFLTGLVIDEPKTEGKATKFSRREQLVRVALDEKTIFARALVNRIWVHFLGRGLVDPVDQMHSGNPASIPPLLDELANDFITSEYDLRRLVTTIVLSRAYRLDGRWIQETPIPAAEHFAVARLRPLSPRQLATSLLLCLGEESTEAPALRLAAIEKAALPWLPLFDPRTSDFTSSTREALFVSNSEMFRKLVVAEGANLTARLERITDDRRLIEVAFLTILSRSPTTEEMDRLVRWMDTPKENRTGVVTNLVWALVASAEFRFNH